VDQVSTMVAGSAVETKPRATQWLLVALRYALPFAAVAAATWLTYLLDLAAPGGQNPFLFFVAVVVTAWFAGAGPGWLAVVLSALAVDYFILPPVYVFDFGAKELPWMLSFVACCVATNALSLQRRRAEMSLKQARDELELRVRERTADLQKTNEQLKLEVIERERAEASLRDIQNDLARATRITTVAEMTASIAHEVNQPLAAIVANANAALNWLHRSPPDLTQVDESVTAIVIGGERAGQVIARIRSLMAKGTPTPVRVHMNDVIVSILPIVQAEVKRREIALQTDLDPKLPPVLADRIQLQQLVLNLLGNAIDAMSDDCEQPRDLVIRTRHEAKDGAVVTVEDSGRGLDDTDLKRIFHPFYSTKQNGMGMGLSICRSIAETHGGRITAAARSPRGAVFRVVLPAAEKP
jgi:C4-dicarboxylate-specific signal transduction histidine kinase